MYRSVEFNKRQCREMYDPKVLEQRNAELQASTKNHMDDIVVDYSPSDPFKPLNISYEVTAKPVFSGCIKFNGKCSLIHNKERN